MKMAPKYSAEVLPSGLEYKKAVRSVPYGKIIHVLNKLHSGMNYSAVGHEFNASESSIYLKVSPNKNTHYTRYVLISG